MFAIKRGECERDQRRVGRWEGADAEAAAVEAGQRLELMLGGGEPVEDDLGVLDQQLAGRREPDPAGAALDQARAGLGLERRDLARHRPASSRTPLEREK